MIRGRRTKRGKKSTKTTRLICRLLGHRQVRVIDRIGYQKTVMIAPELMGSIFVPNHYQVMEDHYECFRCWKTSKQPFKAES